MMQTDMPVHRFRATKLLVAGCLLLGAGFLIKLDATGMIATNVLSGLSRMSAPVMQMGTKDYRRPDSRIRGEMANSVAPPGRPVPIEGGAMRTWPCDAPGRERVQVVLGSDGRPVEANLDIWDPAGKLPFKAKVYSEDGEIRPIMAVVELPKRGSISVRNLGQADFPIRAQMEHEYPVPPSMEHEGAAQSIMGGALRTYTFDPTVEAVEVLLTTGGMPMNSRIEISQGPNTNKQVIEFYCKDGLDRPVMFTLPTPWSGNVIRILNTSPQEYPLTVSVVPTSPQGIPGFQAVPQ
jgi:hypothetical protein